MPETFVNELCQVKQCSTKGRVLVIYIEQSSVDWSSMKYEDVDSSKLVRSPKNVLETHWSCENGTGDQAD